MNNFLKILGGILVFIVIFIFWTVESNKTMPGKEEGADLEYQNVEISIGQGSISALVADTAAKKNLGLGKREGLSPKIGMLFIFERDEKHGIWMKDMNFAIDIIWLDKDFNVVDIKENAEPDSFPEVFYPAENARYVLETRANFAKEHEIEVGDRAKVVEKTL